MGQGGASLASRRHLPIGFLLVLPILPKDTLVFFVVLETFSPSSLSLLVLSHSFDSSVNTLHNGSCQKRLLYWRRLRRKLILLEYELPRGDLPSMADMLL